MRLRQTNLTWQEVGDDVVVLDLDGSIYLKLNGSGRLLWETLAGGATEAALSAMLADRYGIAAEQASADVASFLADLHRRGLVEE